MEVISSEGKVNSRYILFTANANPSDPILSSKLLQVYSFK
jgi:hypothetical protein